MIHGLLRGDAAVGQAERKRKARAGCRQGLEAQGFEYARTSHIPRIGYDEGAVAIVQFPERGGLGLLIDGHGRLLTGKNHGALLASAMSRINIVVQHGL